ncbi:MAG TPA: hypothetical protein ENH98_02930 [archaeon]|nr:hypothetical protein [archaeon]
MFNVFKFLIFYVWGVTNNKIKIFRNKIKSIKILDPACGSGRFLVAIADLLYEVNRVLHPNIRDYEIRKRIIQNNLYGVEIEKKAYIISKLRLFSWLFSTDKSHLKFLPPNPNDLEVDDIPNYIEQSEVKFNLFNVDFLIDFIIQPIFQVGIISQKTF